MPSGRRINSILIKCRYLFLRLIILNSLLALTDELKAQAEQPEDFGYRHLQTTYNGDTVDILVKSAPNQGLKKKPLLLFIQGSLPIPLMIKYQDGGMTRIYSVFVFNPDSLMQDYHLAIISKPNVPVLADKSQLKDDFTWANKDGSFDKRYLQRNQLDYYVGRNISVIKFLQQQPWITTDKLVVSGHSEGSTIAAKIAMSMPSVTHLIYSGGNPLGRIMTIIQRERMNESPENATAEMEISNWKKVVDDPDNTNASDGDPNKTTSSFSIPPMNYLKNLTIPVLICYGTKDASAPFNDYLRVEMIRSKKTNFTFKAYIGTEHNYFPVDNTGKANFDVFNWDKVAGEWRRWLKK